MSRTAGKAIVEHAPHAKAAASKVVKVGAAAVGWTHAEARAAAAWAQEEAKSARSQRQRKQMEERAAAAR